MLVRSLTSGLVQPGTGDMLGTVPGGLRIPESADDVASMSAFNTPNAGYRFNVGTPGPVPDTVGSANLTTVAGSLVSDPVLGDCADLNNGAATWASRSGVNDPGTSSFLWVWIGRLFSPSTSYTLFAKFASARGYIAWTLTPTGGSGIRLRLQALGSVASSSSEYLSTGIADGELAVLSFHLQAGGAQTIRANATKLTYATPASGDLTNAGTFNIGSYLGSNGAPANTHSQYYWVGANAEGWGDANHNALYNGMGIS